jgi:predicted MFS family arabinose efflux permease
MMLTALIIPILPILWFLSSELWHIFPINILGGTLWAGYNIASFNFLLIIAPVEQRARYTALYQIAVASSVALGAAVGGIIVNFWALPVVFLLSGIGRFIAAGFFAKFVRIPQEEQPVLEAST